MPRYVAAGSIEAYKRDNGEDYLLLDEGGGFLGVLDAKLFDRVFRPERHESRAGFHDEPRAYDRGFSAREVVGVPLVKEDLVPASERMAAAIAARTEAGGVGPVRPLRTKDEVDRALEETRKQVEREAKARARIDGGLDLTGPLDPGAGRPYGYKLQPGELPGRGRRVCVRKLENGQPCNTVNPVAGRGGGKGHPCWGCGKAVQARKGAQR